MACTYCYQGSEKADRLMDRETLIQTAKYIGRHSRQLRASNVMVVIHGGEPVLAFQEMKLLMSEIRSIIPNVYFSITTNGLLLTDEVIDYISEEFLYASVSLDGDEWSHDCNRITHNGKGTYKLIIPKALKLLAQKNDVRARMTINPYTVKNLYENVKHLVHLGFGTVAPVPDAFDSDWDSDSMGILKEQLERIVNWKLAENIENKITIIDEVISPPRGKGLCSGGVDTISIDTDGSIFPCTYVVGNSEYRMGHIAEGVALEKIEHIKTIGEKPNDSCVGCSRYHSCSTTRCKIINKVCMGDYHVSSPVFCHLENIKHELGLYYREQTQTSMRNMMT